MNALAILLLASTTLFFYASFISTRTFTKLCLIRSLSACCLLFITCFLAPGSVCAEDTSFNSRKGFTFTLQLPNIGFITHGAQDDGGNFSWLGGAYRLGYGFSDRAIIFIENSMNLSHGFDDRTGIALVSFNVGAQLFPVPKENLFVTPRLGLGLSEAMNEDLVVGNDSDGAGLMAGLGVGYEWRISKSFAVSPELKFDYHRVHGSNAWFTGIGLNLQWY